MARLTYEHALNFPRAQEIVSITASTQYTLSPGVYEFAAYLVNGGTSGQGGTAATTNIVNSYSVSGTGGTGGIGGSSGVTRRIEAVRPVGNVFSVAVAGVGGATTLTIPTTTSSVVCAAAAGGSGGAGGTYPGEGSAWEGSPGGMPSAGYALPSGITVSQSGGGGQGGKAESTSAFHTPGARGTEFNGNGCGGGGGGGGSMYAMTVDGYPQTFLVAPGPAGYGKPGLAQLVYRREF